MPQRAIVWRKGQPGLVREQCRPCAMARHVTLGLRGTQTVEVTKGLTAGEAVIWLHDPKDGPLTEGRAVRRGECAMNLPAATFATTSAASC